MSKQSNPYPLRMDNEVMEIVKAMAEQEGRSLNKQIEIMLKQHLQYLQPKIEKSMEDLNIENSPLED